MTKTNTNWREDFDKFKIEYGKRITTSMFVEIRMFIEQVEKQALQKAAQVARDKCRDIYTKLP